MQDNYEDRIREIQRMHEIYANADLTIAAATGDNANAELIAIDPTFYDDECHTINGQRFVPNRREMREVVELSNWSTRGWTFQELNYSFKTTFVFHPRALLLQL